MDWMLAILVTNILMTRAHSQLQHETRNAEKNMNPESESISRNGFQRPEFQDHLLLDLFGIDQPGVTSALKFLGSVFNFVDMYGQQRYPVLDSNYGWFKWVDRNLPLHLSTYMAPSDQDPHNEDLWEPDYFDDYLYSPYYEKSTSTHNVIWRDFYKKIYIDMIKDNSKSSRSGGTSRQDGFCLDGMYPGYSSVYVDVMGQTFKYLLDNTVTPVYEFFRGRDRNRAHMMKVDPLYRLSEHLYYLIGLSDGEDSYNFYESRTDAQDRSVPCIDTSARVMNAVMPYGPFLTLSNLAAVGVWLVAFWAPFLGL